jgi:hypothetical protein
MQRLIGWCVLAMWCAVAPAAQPAPATTAPCKVLHAQELKVLERWRGT